MCHLMVLRSLTMSLRQADTPPGSFGHVDVSIARTWSSLSLSCSCEESVLVLIVESPPCPKLYKSLILNAICTHELICGSTSTLAMIVSACVSRYRLAASSRPRSRFLQYVLRILSDLSKRSSTHLAVTASSSLPPFHDFQS